MTDTTKSRLVIAVGALLVIVALGFWTAATWRECREGNSWSYCLYVMFE